MDDKRVAATTGDGGDKSPEMIVGILLIDTDPRLHGDRDSNLGPHRLDTGGNPLGLGHQTGSESPSLDSIAGAPHVQVDLVVTHCLTDRSGSRQLLGIGSTQLEGNGVLGRIESEQSFAVTADHRRADHHLGVEQHTSRDQTQEKAFMAVGPVHHRRHANRMIHRTHLSLRVDQGRTCPTMSGNTTGGNPRESGAVPRGCVEVKKSGRFYAAPVGTIDGRQYGFQRRADGVAIQSSPGNLHAVDVELQV